MATIPTRFDGDLFESARSSGAVNSRSAAQQLAHWARIGRELESSPRVSVRDIEAVLAGERSYDSLGDREQAVVRATWDERITERLESLDLAAEFRAAEAPFVEADSDGNLIDDAQQ